MEIPTVRVIRKANKEEVVINQADFDPDLHDLVDRKRAAEVLAAQDAAQKSEASALADADQRERNAGARKANRKAAAK